MIFLRIYGIIYECRGISAAGERATLAVWRSRVRIPYAPLKRVHGIEIFLYILIMKLANGLGHSHLLFMGRCIDLRSVRPLIIWHGELQHGWGDL